MYPYEICMAELRRVPHVEQELLILPEHPSFWTIKKLCSFSWTFPENSRRPDGFYFHMMFTIPEVLVNFAMKNLLKMFDKGGQNQ